MDTNNHSYSIGHYGVCNVVENGWKNNGIRYTRGINGEIPRGL